MNLGMHIERIVTHLLIIAALFERHLAHAHGIELAFLITYKYIPGS